ncbi:MAG TPA: hypothetical protein VFT33_08200, partial [Gaiellaceae bacterium]|nr:hypothetical protein [Gaiellaceae bacterium]
MAELLELRGHRGAFERIEEWLRNHGFFAPGGEALAADLYLGYGLSQAIRRDPMPSPTEPCAALPLAACRLADVSQVTQRHEGFRIGEWEQTSIHLGVGGGIVWDSDPAAEVEESWTKARPLL